MEDELRGRLEEAGVATTDIDEILHRLDNSGGSAPANNQAVEDYLKIMLNNAYSFDWRRRAQIAAQIVSNYYRD